MTAGKLRRPRRVVDLHGHEGDVEVTGQASGLVEMDGGRPGLERIVGADHRDSALADGLDLLGPGIDERDVVARSRQEGAEVAADGSRPMKRTFLAMAGIVPRVTCLTSLGPGASIRPSMSEAHAPVPPFCWL